MKQQTINHYERLLACLRLDLTNRDALIASLEDTIKLYKYNNDLLIKKINKLDAENKKYLSWFVTHFADNK